MSIDYKITYAPEKGPDYLAAFMELCALQVDTIRKLMNEGDDPTEDKKDSAPT